MIKKWSKDELTSLIDTLRRFSRIQDAIIEHNKKWKTNRSLDSIPNKLKREGLGKYGDYLRVSSARKSDLPIEDRVRELVDIVVKSKKITAKELCNRLDVSPRRLEQMVIMAKNSGFKISTPTDEYITLDASVSQPDRLKIHEIPLEPVKDKISYAVISDPHFASKFHRGECLNDFVDLAMERYGVRLILMPGDIMAGINMYRGQLNEVETSSMEGQVNTVIKNLPRRDGLQYKMIGGNHDESFMKAAGADAIRMISLQRDDVTSYGFYSGLIDIKAPKARGSVKVEIFHPEGAGGYALSYHMQKEIEQMPGGMKPNVFLCGHRHTSLYIPDYRGVAGFNCGTFEDQTLYLKRKKISPMIGGWIHSIGVDKYGNPKEFTPTWVRYFHTRRGSLKLRDKDTGDGFSMSRSIGWPVGDSAK